jgi:GNAT superfamily N-acetyltransferase
MRNRLLKKYEKEISYIRNSSGINVVSVEEIQDNEVFSRLRDSFEPYFLLIDKSKVPLKYESSDIYSIVELSRGAKMKIHNCLYFELPDGSHFRFSPHGSDSLEISRIMVAPQNTGQGTGTLMMEIFLEFVGSILGEIPPLYLECTGTVGFGKNESTNTISKQTAFFRKFGFRVNDARLYPEFVSMSRKKENLIFEQSSF